MTLSRRWFRSLVVPLFCLPLALLLGGCPEHESEKGPMESFGEELDDAGREVDADEVGDELDEAAHELDDAAHDLHDHEPEDDVAPKRE